MNMPRTTKTPMKTGRRRRDGKKPRGLAALRADLGAIGRDLYGVDGLAAFLGTTVRSIERWRAGVPMAPHTRAMIRHLARASRSLDMWQLAEGLDAIRLFVRWRIVREEEARAAAAESAEDC